MPQHHVIRPKRFLVELGEQTFECRVIAADILRAEEVAPTFGIKPERSPIALTLVWVWAASKREGHHALAWPDFREALVDWMDLAKATPVVEEADVDPTRPAGPTTSPSVSPSASEDSTSTGGDAP